MNHKILVPILVLVLMVGGTITYYQIGKDTICVDNSAWIEDVDIEFKYYVNDTTCDDEPINDSCTTNSYIRYDKINTPVVRYYNRTIPCP